MAHRITIRSTVKSWFSEFVLAAGVLAALAILGGCNSIHGIAADVEILSREIKQAAEPQTPQIVYVASPIAREVSHD